MRATATRLTAAERAKGIRRVAIPSEGKSVKCRADKSTGDGSGANRGIAPKHQMADSRFHFGGQVCSDIGSRCRMPMLNLS